MKKGKKITSAVLATSMLFSVMPAQVEAVTSSGTAPYINTWLAAGPSENPTAEQIYKGVTGDELIRPADGNWASLAKATATTAWAASPGIDFEGANAIDGNMRTDWASKSNQNDNEPTLTLTWPKAIKVKTIQFYDRHDPGWADAIHTSNVKKVRCVLKNADGEIIEEKTIDSGIDPTGENPGVIEFDQAVMGVVSAELHILYDVNDKSNETLSLGFKEVEVYDGNPIGGGETPNDAAITPVLGEEFGDSDTEWQYFDDRIFNRNTDDYNDFYGYFNVKQGLETEGKYIYAHTYVYSEKEQKVNFNFTAMGPHKLWLNDKEVSQSGSIGNVNSKENYKIPMNLKKGWNKVLLQVQHSGKPYVGIYARFCDANGNAPEGITCSVTGPTENKLTIATQGLDIDREAFEERNAEIEANEYPENVLPNGYAEWPYVWNKTLNGAWYGPQASKFQLQAAGGTPEYKWEVTRGKLPEGLTLNEDGTIDGYCSKETGTYTFTAQVTDSKGETASKEFELVVKERPNEWFEEGGASALSHCAAAYPAYFDSNYSIDLWAERAKNQGITMLSVECKQGPYWWPAPLSESCAEQHAPEVRYQDENGKWHIKDMVKPFKEAADRYGLRFGVYYPSSGGWQFGHDGAYDMVDMVDLVERYDPWYIFVDGGPQNTDNVDVRWSAIRSYNDRILIQANDQKEASDNDINILEQRYYFDTPYLYGGYWENNMLPQNKKTVIECWNGPYVRYFHGEGAQTGLDWRLASKAFVTSIGQGYVWNWDQETSATRGNREWYYNYAPNIPDIYNINTLFNQDMITIRNKIINWMAPEGKPDKRESLFGTTNYIFDYEMQDNYTQEYRSELAIKYGEGPEWGYTRRRDNTFYMHMVETKTKPNELIRHFNRVKDKTGFTGQDSVEAGPFDYKVTSAEWLNEGEKLDFTSFEKDGKYYATIDTSNVRADAVDTIIKIKTADPERTYKLTGVKTYSSQTEAEQLQLRTESNLNDFASVIIPADVTFESSDTSVAAVDKNGLVKKVGNGKADIKVTAVYEGVTKTDTYPVVVDAKGIHPDLDLLGIAMFTGEQEVQGSITPFEHPEVTFQGRTERGGGIDLPFVEEKDITYHYATVNDHAVTTEIAEKDSIFTIEDGRVHFRDRVNEKTNLAFWADVTVNGKTYTTNKMFLWVYPDADLSKEIVPDATSGQEQALYTTDGVAQSKDGYNKEKWTAGTDDKNPALTYDLGMSAKLSGVDIYYNGSYWGYDNMPKQVKVEVSEDGKSWRTALEPVDAPKNRSNYHFDDPNSYDFQAAGRYVRVSFPGGAQDEKLDILEIKVKGLDYSKVLKDMKVEPVVSEDQKTATVDVQVFTGTGEEADLSGAKITVASEDENIAVVDENGVISGKNAGRVKINVTVTKGADTLRDYFYLTVYEDGRVAVEDFLKKIEVNMDNTAIAADSPVTPYIDAQMNSGVQADLKNAEVAYTFNDDRLQLENGKIVLKDGTEAGFRAEVVVKVTLDGVTVESKPIEIVYANSENIGKTSNITVSSTYSDQFKPEFLVDGNKATCWACQGTVHGTGNIKPWFKMDLGGEFEISKINLIERGIAPGRIQEGLLEWEGGSKLLTDIKWEGQPDNVFTFDEPIKTSWLKFTIDPNNTCTSETNHRGLAEFQVFGTPAEMDVETETTFEITACGETKTYAYNEKVSVTAPKAEEGMKFAGWKADGKIVSYKEVYEFYATRSMELIPTYAKESEVTEEAKAMLSNVFVTKRADEKSDVKFVGELLIPEGYELVNAGLIWSSKANTDLIVDDGLNPALKPTYISKISNTNQFSVTIKGMPQGKFIRGIIFAEVKDENGQTKLIHSTEKKAFAAQ